MNKKKLSNSVKVVKCSKSLDSDIKKRLKYLKKLVHSQDSACWEIGDLCVQLLDKYKVKLAHIANVVGYSRTRISHFHLTARSFPPEARENYTFQDSLTARQIYIKFPRLNMTPAEIRKIVVKLRNKTPHQVRAYFVNYLTEMEQNQHLAYSSQSYVYNKDSIVNQCHHGDWQNIIPQLGNCSVQLFICDPPFAAYSSKREETNCLRTDSDNNNSIEDALNVTLPLFELCLPKLKPDGILLLFQGGGQPDRPEILLKAQECGWDCIQALTWNKGSLSTGNFLNPYRICSERILVFCRKGEIPRKFQDGNSSPDILSFETETNRIIGKMRSGEMEYGDYHMFQKPLALMEFLIKHHSYAGDLVVESFGCSGSASIAAAQLNRQWVYCESNRNNFIWGSQRLYKELESLHSQTG